MFDVLFRRMTLKRSAGLCMASWRKIQQVLTPWSRFADNHFASCERGVTRIERAGLISGDTDG
jgi:hypothetical protein